MQYRNGQRISERIVDDTERTREKGVKMPPVDKTYGALVAAKLEARASEK